jgi:fructokinase
MNRESEIVIGIGELLWDCFPDSRRPGGAPANVAFHAQQLGHRGAVCSRVGDDALGNEILKVLTDHEMDTRYIQIDAQKPTGTVTVDTSRPEAPSFVIHEDVAWDHLVFDEAFELLMQKASAVCFGTLAQRHPNSRKTLHQALEASRQAVIVYDVNLRQSWYEKDWIEKSLQASNVVKLNENETVVLSDLLATGTHRQEDTARFLLEHFSLDLVVVTRAERGCLLIGERDSVDEPGKPIEVADSVGAGDAFTAALISSQLRGWPLGVSAWFANRVGSLVAAHHGAMPNISGTLHRIVEEAEYRISR